MSVEESTNIVVMKEVIVSVGGFVCVLFTCRVLGGSALHLSTVLCSWD